MLSLDSKLLFGNGLCHVKSSQCKIEVHSISHLIEKLKMGESD